MRKGYQGKKLTALEKLNKMKLIEGAIASGVPPSVAPSKFGIAHATFVRWKKYGIEWVKSKNTTALK